MLKTPRTIGANKAEKLGQAFSCESESGQISCKIQVSTTAAPDCVVPGQGELHRNDLVSAFFSSIRKGRDEDF